MANPSYKVKENTSGKYYVDDQCIACNACVDEASEYFSMDQLEGHAFVKKQPTSEQAEKLCLEALNLCPVEAIGNDP